MRFLKKPWFISIVLAIVLVVAVQMYVKKTDSTIISVSEKEVRAELAATYGGDADAIELVLDSGVYTGQIEKSGAAYDIEVDAMSGKILSLVQTEEIDPETKQAEQAEQGEEQGEEQDDNQDPSEQQTIISKEEAANIGLAQLPADMSGEIDDIDFQDSEEGGYYLIEIDIDTDDVFDEVTYQIHAISGEVLTTTWDD